nr:methylamine utilization protein [Luteimonas aestuarii]
MLALAALAGVAEATELRVMVSGGDAPLADAVVSLHPVGAGGAAASARADMNQRDSTFVPGVLPVQTGTVVRFPNSDNIQHHVYSFSEAKRFDLPLYTGRDAPPVLFDATGVVVVGCNIHDWMIGHIVVVDTPYFAKTGADGTVRLQAPPGDYDLRVWHVRADRRVADRRLSLRGASMPAQLVELPVTPAPAAVETRGSERLRELQQKFRRMKDGA